MLRMKSTWPGHIHDADDAFVGQPAGGEAEVDGQAALFFLGQRVGLAAGEQLHQRGLAVIHVPGGAEHDVAAGALMRLPGSAD